jgi:GT2 family glycosyltransferase
VQPDLTIVVLMYNSSEISLQAMDQAVASAPPDAVIEELFVDNASAPEHAARLHAERPNATVLVQDRNRGFAGGMNAGIAAARGRYVMLLNDDAFFDADGVARLLAHIEAHPRTGVCGPKLLNRDGSQQLNAYRRAPNTLTVFFDFCFPLSALLYGRALHPYVLPRSHYDRRRAVGHLMGAVLLVRREVFEDAGKLDEAFSFYLEETEWQQRVAQSGWRIELVPDAIATHWGGTGSGGYAFANPNFLAGLDYLHRGRRRVRFAAIAGAAISIVAARIAEIARPDDERFPRLREACTRAIRLLAAQERAAIARR